MNSKPLICIFCGINYTHDQTVLLVHNGTSRQEATHEICERCVAICNVTIEEAKREEHRCPCLVVNNTKPRETVQLTSTPKGAA